ncbi:MAG TPA: plastocyanin/azurin family copper-binding protein [Aurantimonas sp.]
MEAGGGFFASLVIGSVEAAAAGDVVEIAMRGNAEGSRVWFDPSGILIRPGQTIRWTNRDASNSHTATAYHPAVFRRPRRIPVSARPWDSGYLLPDESFSAVFTEPGVYDYYCVPHEQAGMVGRIVVGTPPKLESHVAPTDPDLTPLPGLALAGFPAVEEIIAKGLVGRE